MALNKLYDSPDKYRRVLHEEIMSAGSGKKASLQLITMAKAEHLRVATTVLNHGDGKDKLLVYDSKEDGVDEEVIMTIQGYLLKAKLPPIMRESDIARTKLIHTEQYIRLGGLGDPQFDQSAVAVMAINQLFESRLGTGTLQAWDVKREQEHIVLDFHNRYLTPRSSAPSASIIDMPQDYDPQGILQSHITDEVFTMDNEVKYYERIQQEGGHQKYQYKKTHPTFINVGQLVEVQTSFVVVPRGKNKYKLVCKLQSICVLDRSIENEINKERIQLALRKTSPTRKVKRVVGYDDDDSDEADTRDDMKRMRIDRDDTA